jgi:glycosyltransferase involved in cell wall biosynthesis
MRVVIIADYAVAEGGAPQVAIASALGLARAGHEVVYVQGVGDEVDAKLAAEPRIKRVALGGQDIWKKSALRAAQDGIWNRAHQERLAAILEENRGPNVIVHVHQWTKYFSASLFATLARSGLPLVVSLHDYFLSCPTGLKFRFDQSLPCQLKPLSLACLVAHCDPRSPLHKVIRVARTLSAQRALRNTSFTAVHVSKMSAETIGSYLPANARQVVLENPVEVEDLGPRQGVGLRKIAYCGRLTDEKGAGVVAQAAKSLGAPSLFIGDGPLRDRILEIDPQAEITGWLPKSEAEAKIAAEALALVAPSLWPETGPLVVAEAMAHGVPVVVSARAGAAERIEHGRNGYVVDPTPEGVAEALSDLQAPERAATVAAAAYRSYWANPPSLAAHVRGLVEVYAAELERTAAADPLTYLRATV